MRQFKKSSKVSKRLFELYGAKYATQRPFVPIYFKYNGSKTSYRLFREGDNIYCSLLVKSGGEITDNGGLVEISPNEFHEALNK